MREVRYIIIGQGIAGTVLSMQMFKSHVPHLVIDDPSLSSSSKVAAGIINPIVLKRLKLVKDSELFMPEVAPFYKEWEKKLTTSFYHSIPIKHILRSTEEENLWMEKSDHPSYKKFLGEIEKYKNLPFLPSDSSWGKMKHTAWVNTSPMLDAYRLFLTEQEMYRNYNVHFENIEDLRSEYPESTIIWCTGHLMSAFIPATSKLFSPTRGELLMIRTTELPQDYILHAGIFILPLGNHLFKIGATYHWDKLEDKPSAEGKRHLLEELKKIYTGPFEIMEHKAGVRPNITDRKPILGKINDDYVFNGLGSRGVLMAPYLAGLFTDYLNGKIPLPDHYNITRFT